MNTIRMRLTVIFLLLITGLESLAQGRMTIESSIRGRVTVPFEVSQNLIIVPVSINGGKPLKMVLDSGISNTIITELTGVDTLDLRYAREVTLAGLGSSEPGKAFASTGNEIELLSAFNRREKIRGTNHDCYVLAEDHSSLSKQLGMQVNGLIGSDFFTDFVVEIDYPGKVLNFYEPDAFELKKKHDKYTKIAVKVVANKAYVDASISQGAKKTPLFLMLDTGASLPMWIAIHTNKHLQLPQKTIPTLLGQGLNGSINGVNGRVDAVDFAGFSFKTPLVSFPDSASVSGILDQVNRNGSLGNEILRRFDLILNYPEGHMLIRPNEDFKDPFSYNKSGMEIEKPILNMPVFTVFNVIPGSPADVAGIKPQDQITMINGTYTLNMNLDDINAILHGLNGNTVRVFYNRDGVSYKARLKLHEEL